jgi:putative ABC transport system substrate-binding protein
LAPTDTPLVRASLKRRQFLVALGGAIMIQPRAVCAAKGPARVGFLYAGAAGSATANYYLTDIAKGLRDNALIEGRDHMLDVRYAEGHYDRFPELARDLAKDGANVILGSTIVAVRAAQQLTPPIPVVLVAINDPVGTGLVASLARPGGHSTGVATLNEDLTPKLLEFQTMIVPKAKVIGVISNPGNPSNPTMLGNLSKLAGTMGMTVQSVDVRLLGELDAALSRLAAGKPDALQLLADAAILDLADRIAAFAINHRLPLFTSITPPVELGALLGYGAVLHTLIIRSGYYVKRILGGADPAELPVEQPTAIELWMNRKTAEAIGVAIPVQLEQRVDHMIE